MNKRLTSGSQNSPVSASYSIPFFQFPSTKAHVRDKEIRHSCCSTLSEKYNIKRWKPPQIVAALEKWEGRGWGKQGETIGFSDFFQQKAMVDLYAGFINSNYHTLENLFLQEPKQDLSGNEKGFQSLEEAGI